MFFILWEDFIRENTCNYNRNADYWINNIKQQSLSMWSIIYLQCTLHQQIISLECTFLKGESSTPAPHHSELPSASLNIATATPSSVGLNASTQGGSTALSYIKNKQQALDTRFKCMIPHETKPQNQVAQHNCGQQQHNQIPSYSSNEGLR